MGDDNQNDSIKDRSAKLSALMGKGGPAPPPPAPPPSTSADPDTKTNAKAALEQLFGGKGGPPPAAGAPKGKGKGGAPPPPKGGSGRGAVPAAPGASPRPATTPFRRLLRTSNQPDKDVVLKVRTADGDEPFEHSFQAGPVSLVEQIKEICLEKNFGFDLEGQFHLLLHTQPKSSQKYALSDQDLYEVTAGTEVLLLHGPQFVGSCLSSMTDAVPKLDIDRNTGNLTSEAEDFLSSCESLLRNCELVGPLGEWFATEVGGK